MPTIPRPPRDTRVDILRGAMQIVIFLSHAQGSFVGAWLIHKAWGLSDCSEQFVFLSGLMLGSVHARKVLTQGRGAAAKDVLRRAAGLYRTHLLVFALFGIMIAAVCKGGLFPGEWDRLGWGYFTSHPWFGSLAALATVYMPEYVNILPTFAWGMALLPAFAWLESKWGDWASAAPLGVYACVWLFGLTLPVPAGAHGLGFNPFAWQALFLLGAWLGRRMLLKGEALPANRWLTAGAAGIVLLGLWLRLGWHGFLPAWLPAPLPDIDVVWQKNDLAPLRFLHALSLAWLASCLIPREAGWMRTGAARWLATIGRFSLEVFCLGIFLSWLATAAFQLRPAWAPWIDVPAVALGAVLLGLFARALDRRAKRAARPSAEPAPGAAARPT
jgi:hypothetical protein